MSGRTVELGRVDRYVFLQKMGQGGFGAVYRAVDSVVGIEVAVKTLPPAVAGNAEELGRVRDNFALVAKLRHPGIANLSHLHQVDRVDDRGTSLLGLSRGDFLVIMDFVAGTTLGTWRTRFLRGMVPFDDAIRVVSAIADVLDYAHSQHLIHRDIKPSNIMVTPEGTVRVLDFGQAAEVRSSLARLSGEPVRASGTPKYMAPEQWSGSRQTGLSDQYSLAVLFYELVSGSVPFAAVFESGDLSVVRTVVHHELPPSLPVLAKGQNRALLRALAKTPRERFPSCTDFARALGGKPWRAEDGPGAYDLRALRRRQKARRVVGTRGAALLSLLMALALAAGLVCYQMGGWKAYRAAWFSLLVRLRPGDGDSLALAQVAPTKSQAEMAWRRVSEVGPAGGLAARILVVQDALGRASDAFASKHYELSLRLYSDALAGCEAILALAGARDRIPLRRERAVLARSRAEASGAAEHAPEYWGSAQGLSDAAGSAYGDGDFEGALRLWNVAAEEFDRAAEYGLNWRTLQDARADYDAALGYVEPALLEAFGGDEWESIRELLEQAAAYERQERLIDAASCWLEARALAPNTVRQARVLQACANAEAAKAARNWRLAAEFLDQALSADPGSAAVQALRESIEPHIPLKLSIVSVRDGEAVSGARIVVDGEPAEVTTPATLPVTKGVAHTIRVILPPALGRYHHEFRTSYTPRNVREDTLVAILDSMPGPCPEVSWYVAVPGLDMVWIDPGSTWLGSSEDERVWASSEQGQGQKSWFLDEGLKRRQAILPDGYWIGATEVTIGHWERFVSATRYATQAEKSGGSWAFDWQARKWGHVAGANWLNPGYGESPSPKWPVTCISWQDAVAFCRWLTRVETDKGRLPPGYEYRLPAEGEWERACRGGDSERLFWWGDDVDQARGRLNGSSDDALGGSLAATKWNIGVPWSDGFAWVAPVGAFGASGRNAFGLSDMLGNVSEWCLDGYDPSGAHEAPWYDNTALRVTKGGSFADPPGMLRCANRFGSSASDSFATRGFRVCLGRVRKEPEDPAGTVTSEDGEQDPVADPTDDGP